MATRSTTPPKDAANKAGFGVILKLNLPPEKQYHQGHSLILQADTVDEVKVHLEALGASGEQADFIALRFVEQACLDGFKQAMGATEAPVPPAAASTDAAPSTDAPAPAPSPAKDAASDDLASPAVLKVVAKKTGKSVEELGALTKADAQALLKGGK
jgi:hypothetical protein